MATLTLESDQSEVSKIEADRHARELGQRLKNAFKAAAIPFVAGAVGALIPVVHFVAVPSAIIAIIFLFTREITTHFSFTVTSLHCPHCEQTYAVTEFSRLPLRVACFNCRVTSTLSES